MRVLHLTNRFSALSEQFIFEQLQGTSRLGCENHVLCRSRENESARPWPSVYCADRMLLPRVGVAVQKRFFPRSREDQEFLRWRSYRLAIGQAIARCRPDVVHAQFGHLGALAAQVTTLLRVPLVVHLRGFDYAVLPHTPRWCPLYRQLWPRCFCVIPVAHAMRADVRNLGCPDSLVLPLHNGKVLDSAAFNPTQGSWTHSWCSIGRLVPKKGHDTTIRALAAMRETGIPARLSIVGEGPERPHLEALASALGLQKSVTFLGALPWDEAMAVLRRSDAMVLASKVGPDGDKEGLPNVLMESALIGRPFVTTDHAGNPEALPTGVRARWTAVQDDPVSLADCMTRLTTLRDEERKELVQENFGHAKHCFDLATQSRRLLDVYRRAAKRKQGARYA